MTKEYVTGFTGDLNALGINAGFMGNFQYQRVYVLIIGMVTAKNLEHSNVMVGIQIANITEHILRKKK